MAPALIAAGSSTGLRGATSPTSAVSLGRRLTRIIFFSALGGSATGGGVFLAFRAAMRTFSLSALSGLSGFSSSGLPGLAASTVLGSLTRDAGFWAFPAAFARIFATVSSSRAAMWFDTVTPIPLRSLIRSLLVMPSCFASSKTRMPVPALGYPVAASESGAPAAGMAGDSASSALSCCAAAAADSACTNRACCSCNCCAIAARVS